MLVLRCRPYARCARHITLPRFGQEVPKHLFTINRLHEPPSITYVHRNASECRRTVFQDYETRPYRFHDHQESKIDRSSICYQMPAITIRPPYPATGGDTRHDEALAEWCLRRSCSNGRSMRSIIGHDFSRPLGISRYATRRISSASRASSEYIFAVGFRAAIPYERKRCAHGRDEWRWKVGRSIPRIAYGRRPGIESQRRCHCAGITRSSRSAPSLFLHVRMPKRASGSVVIAHWRHRLLFKMRAASLIASDQARQAESRSARAAHARVLI